MMIQSIAYYRQIPNSLRSNFFALLSFYTIYLLLLLLPSFIFLNECCCCCGSSFFYALLQARLHMHSQDMSYNFKIGYVIIYFTFLCLFFAIRRHVSVVRLRECEKIECINYLALPHFCSGFWYLHISSISFLLLLLLPSSSTHWYAHEMGKCKSSDSRTISFLCFLSENPNESRQESRSEPK